MRKFTDVLNDYLEMKKEPNEYKDVWFFENDKIVECKVYERLYKLEDELNSFFKEVENVDIDL